MVTCPLLYNIMIGKYRDYKKRRALSQPKRKLILKPPPMELRLFNPANLRRFAFMVKSSSKETLESDSNNHPQNLQFRKFSKKDLSRILRTEAAIKAIERKANSAKYNNLWPKAVLEALSDAIKQNRWESALKVLATFPYPFSLNFAVCCFVELCMLQKRKTYLNTCIFCMSLDVFGF